VAGKRKKSKPSEPKPSIKISSQAADRARFLFAKFQEYLGAVRDAMNVPKGYEYNLESGSFNKIEEKPKE
jgi:hypothetical protein